MARTREWNIPAEIEDRLNKITVFVKCESTEKMEKCETVEFGSVEDARRFIVECLPESTILSFANGKIQSADRIAVRNGKDPIDQKIGELTNRLLKAKGTEKKEIRAQIEELLLSASR